MAKGKTDADVAEIPDQEEDPEGYVAHVQKIQAENADLEEQEAEIARQRGNLPPAETDEEREAREKAEAEAAEAQAKAKAEEAQA
jgi:hypothetical protein